MASLAVALYQYNYVTVKDFICHSVFGHNTSYWWNQDTKL